MSAFDRLGFITALPLSEGLLAWTKKQSRETWHEIARAADFASPRATIDLLLALDWITRQPACDRATALLVLTRAAEARLHTKLCPPQMVPAAAKAFCKGLHNALGADCFNQETILLTEADIEAIDAQLGQDGPFGLALHRRRTEGQAPHRPAYAIVDQRPVMPPVAG